MPKVILGPKDDWEDDTYYHVEASFGDNDSISGYVFFSSYLVEGKPKRGYFLKYDYFFSDAIYLRVIAKLTSQKDVDNVPRRYKIVKDFYPF